MLDKVTETLKAPISFGKKNPWAIAALLVAAGIVFLRYSDTVKAKVLKEAPTSSIYRFLASLLGYTVAAFLVLSAGDAFAGVVTGNGSVLSHPETSGVIGKILGVLGSVAGFCTLGYIAGMPGKEIVSHDARNGDQDRTLTDSTPVYWDLSYDETRRGRSVLKATGIEIRIAMSVNVQAGSTEDLFSCNYGKAIKNIELELKNGIGVTFPSTTCSGQFMRLIMTPFCRKGSYGSRYETNCIGNLTAVTRTVFFSILIPFTNDSSASPNDTAIPLSLLNDATLFVTKEPSPFGEGYIISSMTASVVTHVIEDKSAKANKIPALLVPTRYTITASGGQTTMTFKNVGKTSGPVGCNTTNGSRIANLVVQCNRLGLGGAFVPTYLTRIAATQLGLKTTKYVNNYYQAAIGALDVSKKAEQVPYSANNLYGATDANWPLDSTLVPPQSLISVALFIPLVVSGEKTKTSQLPILNGNLDILLESSSPATSGQHILNGIEIRDLGPEVQRACAELQGGRYDATAKKATMDGKDPEKMVIAGMASPVDFKGLPVQLQDA